MAVPLTTYPTSDPASPTSEARWQTMPMQPNGVIWPTRSQGYLAVFADSTGMQVKVTTGSVWINNFYAELTSQATMAVAAPHASLQRKDLVVARLDTSGTYPVISLVVVTGTAAASPVAPTATSLDVPLAVVTVDPSPNATVAASKVTTARIWTGNAAWTDVGTITTRAATGDSNTLVDSSTTSVARYRIVNGSVQINYLLTVFYHGGNPSNVYFGLPVAGKQYTPINAAVNNHSVRGMISDANDSTGISWAQVAVSDLHTLDSSFNAPISNGFSAQFFISGTYEQAG